MHTLEKKDKGMLSKFTLTVSFYITLRLIIK